MIALVAAAAIRVGVAGVEARRRIARALTVQGHRAGAGRAVRLRNRLALRDVGRATEREAVTADPARRLAHVVDFGDAAAALAVRVRGAGFAVATLILFACASWLIDARFPWMSSSVIGPVLPAMSLVPARITTPWASAR